jgi:hypothetical protein
MIHAQQATGPAPQPENQMTTAPLLSIGTFGTHVIGCSGVYSFTGDVPCDIKQGGYTAEKDAIRAFARWFKEQDTEWQRAHVADLRWDVFELVLTTA